MRRFLVSGLLNLETAARVRGFPIPYYPIDYPFFGVTAAPAGVAMNLSLALGALGDEVRLCSLLADDPAGKLVLDALRAHGVSTEAVSMAMTETPGSVVLYDEAGRRQIYCDLKDIQERQYGFSPALLEGVDFVLACNINFNRPLLALAQEQGKRIATDVHVLSDPDDGYNRDFLAAAEVVFLSDEGLPCAPRDFLAALAARYPAQVIVLGRGAQGALLWLRAGNRFVEQPAFSLGGTVNTVGAGDALFASFLHFYAQGCPAEEALRRAQLFAAMKIRTSGAARGFPSEGELMQQYAALSS